MKDKDSTVWAFIGAFLTILGYILILLIRKEDKYAMYYGKHGLVLGIIFIIGSFIQIIPFIGWFLSPVVLLVTLVAWIVTFVAALSGEKKKIPVITELAQKF